MSSTSTSTKGKIESIKTIIEKIKKLIQNYIHQIINHNKHNKKWISHVIILIIVLSIFKIIIDLIKKLLHKKPEPVVSSESADCSESSECTEYGSCH